MGLFELRNFFRHKNMIGDPINDVERELSVLSEPELLKIREGAETLIDHINSEIVCRTDDDDSEDNYHNEKEGPDRTDPGYWKDNF